MMFDGFVKSPKPAFYIIPANPGSVPGFAGVTWCRTFYESIMLKPKKPDCKSDGK
jgi:hypothetical protein